MRTRIRQFTGKRYAHNPFFPASYGVGLFFNRGRHIDPHKPIFKPNERATIPDGKFERGSKIGKKIILVVHRYS